MRLDQRGRVKKKKKHTEEKKGRQQAAIIEFQYFKSNGKTRNLPYTAIC
jgi:hypothetical protein